MSNTIDTLAAIKAALSAGRISTFETAAGVTQPTDPRAVALYAWNAQVAAYLFMPLHICEVVVRNAAADAIEAVHGTNWPWNTGFQASLPTGPGYSPRNDLINVSNTQTTPGKVIPELKFAFWEQMFTTRHDTKIWRSQILRVFPNHEATATWYSVRNRVNGDLQVIRRLRNRIAHHEPIFARNLIAEFGLIRGLVDLRSPIVSSWMMGNEIASLLLTMPPFFCGGQSWTPTHREIADTAYAIWERNGRQPGTEERNWHEALMQMKGR
jgi:hypothetical protein